MTSWLIAAAALAALLLSGPQAVAATPQQKMETCTFGANDKRLAGAARKSFLTKCMSNADSPRGKPVRAAPKAQ
jgi:entry exclusion lipoprotein TrbK